MNEKSYDDVNLFSRFTAIMHICYLKMHVYILSLRSDFFSFGAFLFLISRISFE